VSGESQVDALNKMLQVMESSEQMISQMPLLPLPATVGVGENLI
jgi:putative effector of murein hydrolase LrgA (UPF0299 family)